MILRFMALLALGVALVQAAGTPQSPQWIWGPAGAENEVRFFRRTFTVPTTRPKFPSIGSVWAPIHHGKNPLG